MKLGIVAIIVAAVTVPAHAEWAVMVTDRENIRSSMLIGVSEADPAQQFAVICTTLDGERTSDLLISLALPSTGKFTVRPGDPAAMTVSSGDQVWDLAPIVDQNGTGGFAATVRSPDALAIVSAAAEFSIAVSSGDINADVLIGPEGAQEASRQFLEACGDL